jgi:hypothetical protein
MMKHGACAFNNGADLTLSDAILMISPNPGERDGLVMLIKVETEFVADKNAIVTMVTVNRDIEGTRKAFKEAFGAYAIMAT